MVTYKIHLLLIIYISVIHHPGISAILLLNDNCGRDVAVTTRIKDFILCGYDTTTRPVIDYNNLTKVLIHMKLRYFDYDEHSYTMSIDAWFPMLWDDHHLTWDPNDYEGVTEIHISSDEIWTPDISLYNKGDLSIGPRVFDTADCMVGHDGKVACLPIAELDAICVPDVTYWPYDTQECKIKIGSWIHRGDEIDFKVSEKLILTEGYTPNAEWMLINSTVKRDPGQYYGMNSSYPSVIYTFLIKRHSAAAAATVVMPSLAMAILSLLTMWLEPQSSDRIYLTALNLPCHFLFLEHLNWEVPLNGDTVANIILFYRDSLLLGVCILIETVIVRYLLQSKHKSPVWLVNSFSIMLNNRFGQLLLLTTTDPKDSTLNTTVNEDDGTNLVDVTTASSQNEWVMIGKLLDKTCFIVYIIVYLSMVIFYLPK